MTVITQLFDQLVQHMTNLFHMRFEFCETLFCGLAAHCFFLSLLKLQRCVEEARAAIGRGHAATARSRDLLRSESAGIYALAVRDIAASMGEGLVSLSSLSLRESSDAM
jgi:arginine/ornithine N-succinyltransferase beta subunit